MRTEIKRDRCVCLLTTVNVVGVTSGNCVALVCSINPLAIFVHLAAAQLGCRVVLVNCALSVGMFEIMLT
jgi:acyl-coenzyme A synthetase/AMP-(fatty) acid ligase